jgi:hypothetical protein
VPIPASGFVAAPEWVSLPLPTLCLPPPAVESLSRRVDAPHILLPVAKAQGEQPSLGSTELTRLPIGILTRQLEEYARAAGGRLSLQPSGPELFAEGDAAGIAAARAWLADLEAQTAALAVELTVTLAHAAGEPGISERARVMPGDWVSFGKRTLREFLGDFDVEVAQDSGAAEPALMHALEGITLELSARIFDSSRAIVIVGSLDTSRLESKEAFDPGTLDLGQLELPRLRVATLCFADVVADGGRLELSLELPGSEQPLRLSVEARRGLAAGKPEQGGGSDKRGWQLVDLSVLTTPAQSLPAAVFGATLDRQLERTPTRPRETHIEAGTIASWLTRDKSSLKLFSSTSGSPSMFTDSLLFLPRADPEGIAQARSLLASLESTRLSGGRVRVQQQGLKAEFPVLASEPARLRHGLEFTQLYDYDIEIAGQTWMPDPKVAVCFDGLVLDFNGIASGSARLLALCSEGLEARTLPRKDAWMGALQAFQRSIRTRHWLQGAQPLQHFDANARLETGFSPR